MKKLWLLCTLTALLAAAPAPVQAEETAWSKLGRGLSQIVTSPGEIYTQIMLMAPHYEPSVAIFGGLGKGLAMFVLRELVGVYETVTFPFPIPAGYRPVLDPPTTFTDWQERRPLMQPGFPREEYEPGLTQP